MTSLSSRAGLIPTAKSMLEISLLVLSGVLFAPQSVLAQESPPVSEKAKNTEALVNKAAALVEEKGKEAFSEFRVKNSEWFHGDTYLFVYDANGKVLLQPAVPAREGTVPLGEKDKNGKLFHDEILNTGKKGAGWVSYMLPKPGSTTPSPKWSYVKGMKTKNGELLIIGSGFYQDAS